MLIPNINMQYALSPTATAKKIHLQGWILMLVSMNISITVFE